MLENLTSQIAQLNPLLAEAISKNPWVLPLIMAQMVMKVIFYPIALYKSAKRQQKAWFVVLFIGMLFLNDFGLLPILYLAFNREQKAKKQKRKK